jgi:hypothetical protein
LVENLTAIVGTHSWQDAFEGEAFRRGGMNV